MNSEIRKTLQILEKEVKDMSIVHVSDATFKEEVLNSDKPVLVDFWAAWCGPCRMVAPVVEEIAGDTEGKLKVAKLDVDANVMTSSEYQIMSIPTLMVFKDGKVVDKLVGFMPKDAMMNVIRKHIN